MRVALVIVAAAGALGTMTAATTPARAVCGVLGRHPCTPTVCSVFQRQPCFPEFLPPIGEDLRLTIETAAEPPEKNSRPPDGDDEDKTEHKVDTIGELFAALRSCWVPPPVTEGRHGMQMSVRFSFKRDGEIIGTPRVTYVTPEAPKEIRETYHNAVTAALDRCTPVPFTDGMGGAIAGRPIAIRFVDNRNQPGQAAAQ
jgi:hypothetical protein